jgi:hypothetical protein
MQEIQTVDLDRTIKAILRSQNHIQWKLGKANPHLAKRIRLGHLPENSTIVEYQELIHQVLTDSKAKVYIYLYESAIYPTITSIIKDKLWLVMIGIDGVLETAFPPEDPINYLSNPSFIYIGILEELLK